ncbi:MAG TPA: fatty acid desaturase [bacterium]
MTKTTSSVEFPMAEAKRIVQDLFKPNPLLYWADFLFYDLLGWAAFILAVRARDFSLFQLFIFVVAGFALYRAVLFVHELSHLKKGTFQVFRWIWNLLCGFPLTLPSFLYVGVHTDHHKQQIYGTKDDPEYFAFALAKPYRIPLFPLTMLVAPAFFLLRFLVLAPLSYIFYPLRKPLWVLASHLAAGGTYRRPLPDPKEKRSAWIQEFMTFAYLATGVTLMAQGILPWKVLLIWYFIAVFILVANSVRSLAAHCDRNPPGHVMSFEEQIQDSTDIPGNLFLTPLWAPVGLRYHATHHLFNGIPYHSLGEAHRRLTRNLPKNSPYRLSLRKSLWSALAQLWKEARQNNEK